MQLEYLDIVPTRVVSSDIFCWFSNSQKCNELENMVHIPTTNSVPTTRNTTRSFMAPALIIPARVTYDRSKIISIAKRNTGRRG